MGSDDPFPATAPASGAPLTAQRQAELKKLCDEIERSFETEQFAWLESLVNTPSYTRAPEDVESAARLLDAMAKTLGLSRRQVDVPDGRFASHRVFSTNATTDSTRALALVGHVDTVFPRSTGFLELRRESGADDIYGPGVLDMKSGLSVIFFALRAIREVFPGSLDKTPLRVICNSDEEVGSPSSAALFEELAPLTSAALVFEGGRVEDRIITRRKGGGSFILRAKGRAAHAGNNHADGRNAIVALAHVLPRIEALTDYSRGVTVNVGLMQGGTAKNTVPEDAWCEIDTRFETRGDAEQLVDALNAIASRPFEGLSVPTALHDVQFEISGRVSRYPMEATSESQALRRAYEQCASFVDLGIGEAPLQGGGSDANLLAAAGVPCIDGLGPFGQYFHQTREWSSLSSLKRRTQALACFLWAQAPAMIAKR